MLMRALSLVLLATASIPASAASLRADEHVWLDELDLSSAVQQYGVPRANHNADVVGGPLSIGGVRFDRGVGSHAVSAMAFALDGNGLTFSALVGVDDGVPRGSGSVQFVVLGDGRELWRSPVMRSGDAALPVEVSLHGVARLDLLVRDGDDFNSWDWADWAMACVKMQSGAPRPVPFTQRIRVDLDERHQVLEGFGAWDCWTAQDVGKWSGPRRERVADLLFSTVSGIGLSAWRFDIGAGKNDVTLHDPARTSETFLVAPGRYDWSRQAGERWFLRAAKARGVKLFVAGVLSPPASMTRNHLTTGPDSVDPTNLRKDREEEFCRYVADVVAHFARDADAPEQVAFARVSPFNCPDHDWIDRGIEGDRADNDTIERIAVALHRELDARGLSCSVLAPETGVISDLWEPVVDSSRRFHASYGSYVVALASHATVAAALDHTLSFHSNWTDDDQSLVSSRRRARELVDHFPGWRLWQTEYHVERDPTGRPTNGVDMGMDAALMTARVIHYDLTLLDATFWSWFQGVSTTANNYGLLDTGWRAVGDGESLFVPKLFWAFGNYSRFLRPGTRRVGVANVDYGLGDLLVSAWRRKTPDEVVLVLVNESASPRAIELTLDGDDGARRRFTPWVTSETAGADLAEQATFEGSDPFVVPARSVVTLVGRRVGEV